MDAATSLITAVNIPDISSTADLHLTDLQKAMLDASPDCIKMLSVDGKLITMNRAGSIALNIPLDADFGMEWIPLLGEDVRESGYEALRTAASGQNARFSGKSENVDGIMYWDNMLSPLIDADGKVIVILCVSRDITEQVILERKLEKAAEREKLLARETQHRVKNLLAVVSGLIFIAEKEARGQKNTVSVGQLLREKIGALARASDVAFSGAGLDDPSTGEIDLGSLIRSVLQPYGGQCSILGTTTLVNSENMTTLALVLHELATNSVKYGALSAGDGNVTVRWSMADKIMKITWVETGGPHIIPSPDRQGFGSEMADRIIRSAGGTITRTWRTEGLIAEMQMPDRPHS